MHACRLLHAPRDAIPVPCADLAPLESFTALAQQREPAAPLRRRPAQPVVIRLRPGSAQGVGIAVLGAAAVLPDADSQRRGGTGLPLASALTLGR